MKQNKGADVSTSCCIFCLVFEHFRRRSYIIRVGPCLLWFAAIRVDNIQVLIAQKTATAQHMSIEDTGRAAFASMQCSTTTSCPLLVLNA